MSPENNEQVSPPEPPVGEPEEAAAELALDEALSGEPVTEDGDPVEPLVEEDAPAAPVAPAEPAEPAELAEPAPAVAAGGDAPAEESAAQPEAG